MNSPNDVRDEAIADYKYLFGEEPDPDMSTKELEELNRDFYEHFRR